MTKKLSRGFKVIAEWMMLISFIAFITFLFLAFRIDGDFAIISGTSAMICVVTSLISSIDNF